MPSPACGLLERKGFGNICGVRTQGQRASSTSCAVGIVGILTGSAAGTLLRYVGHESHVIELHGAISVVVPGLDHTFHNFLFDDVHGLTPARGFHLFYRHTYAWLYERIERFFGCCDLRRDNLGLNLRRFAPWN